MNKFIKDIKHFFNLAALKKWFNFAALKKWVFKTSKFKKTDVKLIFDSIKKNNLQFIISFIIIPFFSYLIYLSLPSFYNYESFEKEIQNKILKDFKLNIKNIKGIQYGFSPQPHFIIEESGLYFLNNDKNELAKVKNLKVYIFLKNLHNLDKIELKKIRFNKVNFNFELADIKNFYKHLNTNITKPIEIRNSNFFYKNEKKKIISISNSKKFDYLIDIRERQKKINIIGNIFGTNYKFDWIKNFSNPTKTQSNVNFQNPNINIVNSFEKNYQDDNVKGTSEIKFLNNITSLNYIFNKNKIKFIESEDKTNIQRKIKLLGNIYLEPFFFNLKLELSNLKFKNVINELSLNINRLDNSVHKNFNGNLNINLNNLNSKLFENFKINIKFFEEKILLNNPSIDIKNIGKINFLNLNIFEKDGMLFLKSKIEFKIHDEKEFYQRFQVSKNNRIKLNKFYFDFENNLDEDKYYLSSFYLKDKNETSDKENLKSDYYEISNFQQLSTLIKKEFKMIKLD